jgi:hypothetical protein
MNFPCTTAAFTLSPAPGGLRHLVLTRPGTEPSMRFLFVGSHLCARASSRQPLAELPLPSASSCFRPLREHHRYSYRGLSPYQFMPMPGVHQEIERTPLRSAAHLLVIAPSKARHFLRGASPRRARASHPPVSSLGSAAEPPKGGEQGGLSVDRESHRP